MPHEVKVPRRQLGSHAHQRTLLAPVWLEAMTSLPPVCRCWRHRKETEVVALEKSG
jgi:hypothetical protein